MENSTSAIELTDMESKVIAYLSNCDDYDEKPYAHIDDISEYTKIEIKSLRGVLSSLIQKDLIELQHDFFRKGDTIIFKNI